MASTLEKRPRRSILTALGIAVGLVNAAIAVGMSQTDKQVEFEMIAMASGSMTPAEAAKLEAAVARNPADLTSRVKLIGYYSRNQSLLHARRKHALWIVENKPGSGAAVIHDMIVQSRRDDDLHRALKAAWIRQVQLHAKSARVLGNAAQFHLLPDRIRSERLLKQAEALEPQNAEWPDSLGNLYHLEMGSDSGQVRRTWAKKALAAFERARKLEGSSAEGGDSLGRLAGSAYEAGEYVRARKYAAELVRRGSVNRFPTGVDGDAVHHGNLVLGRLALHEGNVKKAGFFLLAAGRTPGSPPLGSFGPNMLLAKELLEKGERKVVLDYFDLCRKFWGRDVLDDWAEEVKKGQIPDFGANLRY
jgi:hypothetical protein